MREQTAAKVWIFRYLLCNCEGFHLPICANKSLLLLWHPKSLSLSATCNSGGYVMPCVSNVRQEEGKKKGKFVSPNAET